LLLDHAHVTHPESEVTALARPPVAAAILVEKMLEQPPIAGLARQRVKRVGHVAESSSTTCHALPLHEWRRAERVLREPLSRTLHQKLVKAVVGQSRLNLSDVGTRNAESKHTEREVDQITLSKELDERVATILNAPNLVVHLDHKADFFSPCLSTNTGQVHSCSSTRRRNVIDRVVGPKADVMETCGNR
jgi:hypothetical protein